MTHAVPPRSQEALRNAFLNGCVNKRGFPSAGTALKAKDRGVRLGGGRVRNGMRGTVPYQCQFCGDWHLGHDRFAT